MYDNSGSISKNTRKEKDTHPDIKGKATIGGVNYWVDGWAKTGENGPWYSLSFKVREDKQPEARPKAKMSADGGDDTPF